MTLSVPQNCPAHANCAPLTACLGHFGRCLLQQSRTLCSSTVSEVKTKETELTVSNEQELFRHKRKSKVRYFFMLNQVVLFLHLKVNTFIKKLLYALPVCLCLMLHYFQPTYGPFHLGLSPCWQNGTSPPGCITLHYTALRQTAGQLFRLLDGTSSLNSHFALRGQDCV